MTWRRLPPHMEVGVRPLEAVMRDRSGRSLLARLTPETPSRRVSAYWCDATVSSFVVSFGSIVPEGVRRGSGARAFF